MFTESCYGPAVQQSTGKLELNCATYGTDPLPRFAGCFQTNPGTLTVSEVRVIAVVQAQDILESPELAPPSR